MGFEPTQAEPNGLAVHRRNHSATSSFIMTLLLQAVLQILLFLIINFNIWNSNKYFVLQIKKNLQISPLLIQHKNVLFLECFYTHIHGQQ